MLGVGFVGEVFHEQTGQYLRFGLRCVLARTFEEVPQLFERLDVAVTMPVDHIGTDERRHLIREPDQG